MVTARVDLDHVTSYRAHVSSLREQASCTTPYPTLHVDAALCSTSQPANEVYVTTAPVPPRLHCAEEEIALGPACWLWDYLRRSGASG